jgi:hypothetical protein
MELNLHCLKCEEEYKILTTLSKYEKGDYKKFCSRKCANSRIWSEEHKRKLSEINKKSEKVKTANSVITDKRKKSLDDGRNKRKRLDITNDYICKYCGEPGIDNKKKGRKYHTECWKKASGGIRKGSSRGKCGCYKGYWCDSSYELAYLIYNLENDIKIERNKKGYEYYYNNEKHTFFPDFIVNNKLVEIKNFRSELTDIKLKSVNKEIKIYYKDTIKPYLDYVIKKYGKKFIEMYEKKEC